MRAIRYKEKGGVIMELAGQVSQSAMRAIRYKAEVWRDCINTEKRSQSAMRAIRYKDLIQADGNKDLTKHKSQSAMRAIRYKADIGLIKADVKKNVAIRYACNKI